MMDGRVFFPDIGLNKQHCNKAAFAFFYTDLSLRTRWRPNLGTCTKKQKVASVWCSHTLRSCWFRILSLFSPHPKHVTFPLKTSTMVSGLISGLERYVPGT